MKKNLKFYALILLSVIFIASCKKTDQDTPLAESKNDAVLSYIKSLGFSANSIKDIGVEYLVDGDITFAKNMEIPLNKSQKVENNLILTDRQMSLPSINDHKIGQYYGGTLVNQTNRINVRIMVDPSMNSMINEINSAIGQWNNEPSGISFSIVSSGSYDILIKDANLGNGGCGRARFPLNGKAGDLVEINKSYISGNSFDQRQRTITHELGHTIGFRHTNWSANGENQNDSDLIGTPVTAIDVPNAGGTDANSLMNGSQCGMGAAYLSAKDKLALINLYPIFYNAAVSQNFTQTNCSTGTPDVVPFTIPAGTYSSKISQADADQKAANALASQGQANANYVGTCGGTKPKFTLSNSSYRTITVNIIRPTGVNYFTIELRNYQTGVVTYSTATSSTGVVSVSSSGYYGIAVVVNTSQGSVSIPAEGIYVN